VKTRIKKEFSLFHKLSSYSKKKDFSTKLNFTKRRVWKACENVCRNFLGNEKGGILR
jgi:hypothetical protein